MTRAQFISARLLEDEGIDPQNPEQPPQAAPEPEQPEGGEDVRDLFLRLNAAPEPYHAKGEQFGTRPYQRKAEELGRRSSRKIAKATYLLRNPDNSIALRYHETDLITWHPDGKVTVTSGGWPTKTTRERMSGELPGGWSIYSESFKKHGEDTPELWVEPSPGGLYGDRGGYIRGGIGKMFWYNRQTNAGTWESGWYIPFTDGDTITPDGVLHAQATPKQRGKRRADHGWP